MNNPMHAASGRKPSSFDECVRNLSPRFEIRRELGAGSFGTVWEAFDKEREQLVALKTLHRVEPVVLYRFKQEFRSLADIEHPNLVRLHELFCLDETWFFTMDLIEGTNFLTYVRGRFTVDPNDPTREHSDSSITAVPESQPDSTGDPVGKALRQELRRFFDEERLRSALRQLVQGVEALHGYEMLHRDLKPSNVLISREGRVRILDFGLVRDVASNPEPQMSVERQALGTPAYMSPEQSMGIEVGQPSDWYSVGVMLFEALTGVRPFSGNLLDLIAAKQKQDAPDPRSIVENIPSDLAEIAVGLLSRSPENRLTGTQIIRHLEGRQVLSSRRPSSKPPNQHTKRNFVGRTAQLETIRGSFLSILSGSPAIVRIIGKSGFGKSALVSRASEVLKEQHPSTVVLKGRCYEQESVPYKALDSLVDSLTRYLVGLPHADALELMPRNVSAIAKLFPVLSRVRAVSSMPLTGREVADPQEQRARAFSALRELFARLADRRPLVLIVDDMQWGDADSARFFCDLFTPPDPPLVMLIQAFREENVASSQVLQILEECEDRAVDSLNTAVVVVGPIEVQEARTLAQGLLGAETNETIINTIAAESLGNPFFVRELVQQVKDVGQSINGGIRLDDLLAERISRLSDSVRQVLEIVAIAGHPIARGVIRRALPPRKDLGEALVSLRHSRLILTRGLRDDATLETYHDRVRETVLGMIPNDRQKAYHKSLAEALLECQSKDTESLARHFLSAGESAQAVDHLLDAADRASEKLAFERAVGLYRMILEISPDFNPVEIRTKLGHALAFAGRGADAAKTYFEAAKQASSSVALGLNQKAASQLLRAGYYDQGLAALRSVATELGLFFPKSRWFAIASLLLQRLWVFLRGYSYKPTDIDNIAPRTLMRIDTCWALMSGLGMVDPIAGLDFQTRTMLLVLKAGESSRVARALLWESVYIAAQGTHTLESARKVLKLGVETSRKGQNLEFAGVPEFAEGIILFFAGQWKRSFEIQEDGRRAFLRHPTNDWEYTNSCHYSIWALAYLGEYAEMQRRVKARLRETLERGDIYSATAISVGNSNLAWIADDEPGAARGEATAAISRWSRQSYHVPHYFYDYAIVQIDLYCGDVESAYRTIETTWRNLEKAFFLLMVQHTRSEAMQIRARCAVALAHKDKTQRAHLLSTAESLAKRLIKENAPYSKPYASLIRAAIHWQSGARRETITQLEEAMIDFEKANMSGYANAAKRRLGVLLDNQKGLELIAQADAWMREQAIVNPVSWTQMLAPGLD